MARRSEDHLTRATKMLDKADRQLEGTERHLRQYDEDELADDVASLRAAARDVREAIVPSDPDRP